MGQKDRLLKELSDEEIVALAKSLTSDTLVTGSSRSDLTKLIKEVSSVERIKSELRHIRAPINAPVEARTPLSGKEIFYSGETGQLLLAVLMIIPLFVSVNAYLNPIFSFTLLFPYPLGYFASVYSLEIWIIIFTIVFLAFVLGIHRSLQRMAPGYQVSRWGEVATAFGIATVGISFVNLWLTAAGLTVYPVWYWFSYLPQPSYLLPTPLGLELQFTLNALIGLTVMSTGLHLVATRGQVSSNRLWTIAGALYSCSGGLVLVAALTCASVLVGGTGGILLDSPAVILGSITSGVGAILLAVGAFLGREAFSRL